MTAKARALMILHEARETSADRIEYDYESDAVLQALVAQGIYTGEMYAESVYTGLEYAYVATVEGTRLRVSYVAPTDPK